MWNVLIVDDEQPARDRLRRLLEPMTDFAAADYQGQTRRFAELRGEKATLLAFWFPT